MKNLVKFVVITVAVSLICGAAPARKGNEGERPDKGNPKAAAADSRQAHGAAKEAKDVNDKWAGRADKARRGPEDRVRDANAAGDKNKSGQKRFLGFRWGKNHQEQLKALDEKSARTEAQYKEKIGVLEKELAAAQAANETKKVEKLEKNIAVTRQTSEGKMKKIEAKRAKIQAEMAKEK